MILCYVGYMDEGTFIILIKRKIELKNVKNLQFKGEKCDATERCALANARYLYRIAIRHIVKTAAMS